jgi:hypothetical protein
MKKVGLVINFVGVNYGMILQAYATQHYLDKTGLRTAIIKIKKSKGLRSYVSKLKYLTKPMVLKIVLKKRQRKKIVASNPVLRAAQAERKRTADIFAKERFHDVLLFSSEVAAREAAKGYDAVMVGSDQRWNPAAFYGNVSTLMFVPDEVRKISYATSLGVSSIPKHLRKRGKEFLSRIDYLSVREPSGKRIVDSLVGEKAVVVLDPTLLLTKKDWDSLIEKTKLINEPYVFCYFLGDNTEYLEEVRQFCSSHSYKMVVIRNIETYTGEVPDIGDIILEGPSVEEFVNYIRYANVVCTDSFHGTVFSIINHRPFVSFYRTKSTDKNSRNSRIDDLLGGLSLHAHIYSMENSVEEIVGKVIDYNVVDDRLSKLRQDSTSFLNKALK